MSTADRQSQRAQPTGAPAFNAARREPACPADGWLAESTRNLLLTFIFDLASQHVRNYRQLDFENLAHEIGIRAFEQMRSQPAAREKVYLSFREGTEEWKRVAHMCVIHARAERVRREIFEMRRRSGIPVEEIDPKSPHGPDPNERLTELRHCIALLDEERQTVIRLHFECGLTFQEIAVEMNWSKTRVYGCYATAIVQLQRFLKSRL